MELLLQNGIIMERQGKILFIFNCQASTYFIAIYCWRVYKAEALYKRWNWHFDTNSTRFDRNSVIFFIGRNFDNRIMQNVLNVLFLQIFCWFLRKKGRGCPRRKRTSCCRWSSRYLSTLSFLPCSIIYSFYQCFRSK